MSRSRSVRVACLQNGVVARRRHSAILAHPSLAARGRRSTYAARVALWLPRGRGLRRDRKERGGKWRDRRSRTTTDGCEASSRLAKGFAHPSACLRFPPPPPNFLSIGEC